MGMEDRNMELKKVLQNIMKKSKINFTLRVSISLVKVSSVFSGFFIIIRFLFALFE